jgi:hypothetical protein
VRRALPPVDRGGRDPSSGPRRLVRTPVAVHLLPGEKENTVLTRAGAPKTPFSLSEARGWLAPRAFTSGREPGEGLLSRVVRHRPHCIDNLPHQLFRVLHNHGVRNAQQSYAEQASADSRNSESLRLPPRHDRRFWALITVAPCSQKVGVYHVEGRRL